jgi:hypothetical protein
MAARDANYYQELADAIGDKPYTDTSVFNDSMSMETFVAVVFKRGQIDIAKQHRKIAILIAQLSDFLADSPATVARLTENDLGNFPGPLQVELKKFIAACECLLQSQFRRPILIASVRLDHDPCELSVPSYSLLALELCGGAPTICLCSPSRSLFSTIHQSGRDARVVPAVHPSSRPPRSSSYTVHVSSWWWRRSSLWCRLSLTTAPSS